MGSRTTVASASVASGLGLPDFVRAALFDLDGVLTDTASVHAAAWKEVFDAFLAEHATGADPFDIGTDYARYVDGRIRADGVRTFLHSRGITLPEGDASDPPGTLSVRELGDRKNAVLLEVIERDGVKVYPGSRRYLEAVRASGCATAVVSASANAGPVLDVTGLASYVDVRVDGVVAADRSLPGKPAPDTFLAAAQLLGSPPRACAVFEDALAGVEAGRAGNFGHVVGVDRMGQADALRAAGADVVVQDLAELLTS
jgi:beta-phosphoglucomutase family hydrolase